MSPKLSEVPPDKLLVGVFCLGVSTAQYENDVVRSCALIQRHSPRIAPSLQLTDIDVDLPCRDSALTNHAKTAVGILTQSL